MDFKGVEICCPRCRGDLSQKRSGGGLSCVECSAWYPVVADIPDLRIFSDPYIEADADRAKGLRLAARSTHMNFAQLVAFYYSITPDVPFHRARQYYSSVMAGAARAKASLAAWEKDAADQDPGDFLEIGCGTGPLLMAAASHYRKLAGVDIAFRWLVVAKKRLAEAGLDIPLICACAEALPFPDSSFNTVVMDSTVEHTRDQRKTLEESQRVMRSGGRMFISTPNRFSLGPDPHVGIWAGGYLPASWVAAYAKWRGARPPQRRLFSARSLNRLVRDAGFLPPRILLPAIAEEQREYQGEAVKLAASLYNSLRRMPVARQALLWVGPLLWAIAQKPAQEPRTAVAPGGAVLLR